MIQQYLLLLVLLVRLCTWHVIAYECCWKTWKAILLITRGFGKFEFATKDLQIGWQIEKLSVALLTGGSE